MEDVSAKVGDLEDDSIKAKSNVSISNLTKIYDEDSSNPVKAIEDVALEITENEFVSIIGPSGCGKTTLLKCIGDIVSPTYGDIKIGGQPPRQVRKNRELAFFFQEDVLLPWRTVRENIMLPLVVQGRDTDDPQIGQRVNQLINSVGLQGFEDEKPAQLSGGMRQRVALARGFVYDPKIFLMDEPFAALDELTRRKMNKQLLDIHQEVKKTTILVTHHIPEAIWLSDRVVVLSDRPGTVDRIVNIDLPRPRDEDTRQRDEVFELEQMLTNTIIELE